MVDWLTLICSWKKCEAMFQVPEIISKSDTLKTHPNNLSNSQSQKIEWCHPVPVHFCLLYWRTASFTWENPEWLPLVDANRLNGYSQMTSRIFQLNSLPCLTYSTTVDSWSLNILKIRIAWATFYWI